MRIISGTHKGRILTPPRNLRARPTTDFAKENLFNVLVGLVDIEGLEHNQFILKIETFAQKESGAGRKRHKSQAADLNQAHQNDLSGGVITIGTQTEFKQGKSIENHQFLILLRFSGRRGSEILRKCGKNVKRSTECVLPDFPEEFAESILPFSAASLEWSQSLLLPFYVASPLTYRTYVNTAAPNGSGERVYV